MVKRQDGSSCDVILPYIRGNVIFGRDKNREFLIHILGTYSTSNRATEVYRALIGNTEKDGFELPLS